MFSTGKDDWGTPPALFHILDGEFGFDTDVAANASNHLCARWLGPCSPFGEDGLDLDVHWGAMNWCNPPYSRGLQKLFISRASLEVIAGRTTVMLLPARTDTLAFHKYIWDIEKHQPRPGVEVRFLKGRIKFVGATAGAPFPSMIVIFRGAV
jgi:site-specific DNA-methyltransferase (adenine-specific)